MLINLCASNRIHGNVEDRVGNVAGNVANTTSKSEKTPDSNKKKNDQKLAKPRAGSTNSSSTAEDSISNLTSGIADDGKSTINTDSVVADLADFFGEQKQTINDEIFDQIDLNAVPVKRDENGEITELDFNSDAYFTAGYDQALSLKDFDFSDDQQSILLTKMLAKEEQKMLRQKTDNSAMDNDVLMAGGAGKERRIAEEDEKSMQEMHVDANDQARLAAIAHETSVVLNEQKQIERQQGNQQFSSSSHALIEQERQLREKRDRENNIADSIRDMQVAQQEIDNQKELQKGIKEAEGLISAIQAEIAEQEELRNLSIDPALLNGQILNAQNSIEASMDVDFHGMNDRQIADFEQERANLLNTLDVLQNDSNLLESVNDQLKSVDNRIAIFLEETEKGQKPDMDMQELYEKREQLEELKNNLSQKSQINIKEMTQKMTAEEISMQDEFNSIADRLRLYNEEVASSKEPSLSVDDIVRLNDRGEELEEEINNLPNDSMLAKKTRINMNEFTEQKDILNESLNMILDREENNQDLLGSISANYRANLHETIPSSISDLLNSIPKNINDNLPQPMQSQQANDDVAKGFDNLARERHENSKQSIISPLQHTEQGETQGGDATPASIPNQGPSKGNDGIGM